MILFLQTTTTINYTNSFLFSSPPPPPPRPLMASQSFLLLFFIFLTSLSLFPLLSSQSTITTNSTRLKSQSIFLNLMQDSLSGPYRSQWDFTNSTVNPLYFCTFAGITCNDYGHVITIDISGWFLKGRIPADMCSYLPMLRSLRLGNNDLRGNFPADVLNCSHLEELNLSSTGLEGTVPDLSRLTSLRLLDMSGNRFTGEFPISITNLTNLEVVNFNENPGFHTWWLPEDMMRLTKLTVLVLSTVSLRGEIPEWIGNMTSLMDLELCGNYHVGRIPATIGKVKNLRHLELYYNLIEGEIPAEIGNLTQLTDLDMSVNHLTGNIPESICKLPELHVLQLYNNSLTGEIPPVIANSTTLTILSLYQNFLSGELPANIGESSELVVLELSENRLSGELPRNACARGKLLYILVLDNLFTGGLPESYANCDTLLRFRVGNNRLSGPIPAGLLGLKHVSIIDIGSNRLEGTIPVTIANAKNLSALFMQSNQISGPLPPEISMATSLVKIDLSNNILSGAIPSELGKLTKLNLLSLQGNKLSSSIPASLSSLKSLNVLNLSNNLLTGEIPESLCGLLPNSLVFSNNHLSGSIPLPLLREGLRESFSGNPDLCVPAHIFNSSSPTLRLCSRPNLGKKLGSIWIIVVSAAVSVAGGLLLVKRWLNNNRVVIEQDGPLTSTSSSYDITSFHKVSFDQHEIVEALVDKNIVGHGGSGTVYRIHLSNGDLVAVKKLWTKKASKNPMLTSDRFWCLDRELRSEVDTLGSIRHKNIVKLYCCCSSSDSNLLVYEYMPNGNLWEALHRGRSFLDWPTRFKIAHGVAQGLAYLHHDLLLPIVHRDIKSSNVLLDAENEPKVADFGIAKVLQARGEDSSTTTIAGTCGYLAPECAYSSKATTKCDVYSYGVVLMELVTGKKPSEPEFGENKDIVHWVSGKVVTREGATEVLDQQLSEDSCKEEMIRVLHVALRCSYSMPALRPSMNEVVQLLMEAVDPCKLELCRLHGKSEVASPTTTITAIKNPT